MKKVTGVVFASLLGAVAVLGVQGWHHYVPDLSIQARYKALRPEDVNFMRIGGLKVTDPAVVRKTILALRHAERRQVWWDLRSRQPRPRTLPDTVEFVLRDNAEARYHFVFTEGLRLEEAHSFFGPSFVDATQPYLSRAIAHRKMRLGQ